MLKTSPIFPILLLLALGQIGVDALYSEKVQNAIQANMKKMNFPDSQSAKMGTTGQLRTSNPEQVTDDILLFFLCLENPDGNYQNPYNCNEFIMCASGNVYRWTCPRDWMGNLGWYVPVPDLCGYSGEDKADTCPWPSIWETPTCEKIGQLQWYSKLTLQVDPPEVMCPSEIIRCFDYEEVWRGECSDGWGYSKAFNGCLPFEVCLAVDSDFDWTIPTKSNAVDSPIHMRANSFK